MRTSSWDKDPQYIVNLALSLIGNNTLDAIIREQPGGYPDVIYSYVLAAITGKVKKMNYDTLGKICSYASSDGAHGYKHPKGTKRPEFINCTGLNQVFASYKRGPFANMEPGEYLERIAVGVVACIVVDAICQNDWQAKWDTWEMTEGEEKTFRNHDMRHFNEKHVQ